MKLKERVRRLEVGMHALRMDMGTLANVIKTFQMRRQLDALAEMMATDIEDSPFTERNTFETREEYEASWRKSRTGQFMKQGFPLVAIKRRWPMAQTKKWSRETGKSRSPTGNTTS